MFCYIYVIETKNRTLEETAALFDGEDATNNLIQASAAAAQGGEAAGDIPEKGSDSSVHKVEE